MNTVLVLTKYFAFSHCRYVDPLYEKKEEI